MSTVVLEIDVDTYAVADILDYLAARTGPSGSVHPAVLDHVLAAARDLAIRSTGVRVGIREPLGARSQPDPAGDPPWGSHSAPMAPGSDLPRPAAAPLAAPAPAPAEYGRPRGLDDGESFGETGRE